MEVPEISPGAKKVKEECRQRDRTWGHRDRDRKRQRETDCAGKPVSSKHGAADFYNAIFEVPFHHMPY